MWNIVSLPLHDALLVAALCQSAVFIAFLLSNRKGAWRLNLLLAFVLFFAAIPALSTFILAQEARRNYFPAAHIGNATVFIIGPLLFLYVRKYLDGRFLSLKADVFHIVLFPFALALFIFLAVLQGHNYSFQNLDIYSSLGLFLYTALYFALSLGVILKSRRNPAGGKRPVFWPVFLFAGDLVLLLGRFVIFVTWDVFGRADLCPYTYNLFFMAFIFFMNILLLLALSGARAFRHEEKYRHSKMSSAEKDRLEERLREMMEKERPYLSSQLSLDSMALAMCLTPKELSQIVNERFGMNFSDFVNSFRVREMIRLLSKHGGARTILDLSLEAGFNSKSTFNQAFKKFTGSSPREYLHDLKNRAEDGRCPRTTALVS